MGAFSNIVTIMFTAYVLGNNDLFYTTCILD